MNKDPWIGENLNKHVKVLILGESHYDEESNYGDRVGFSTAGVVENYFYNNVNDERKRWAPFFDKIAASFGYDWKNAKNFYEQVYFGNYVDVICGVQDNNCALYYIKKNRREYNNELFEFINENSIEVVICFSVRVYDHLPRLSSKLESYSFETVGYIGNKRNNIYCCSYCHAIEHKFCDVKLKHDLKVYGVRHPSGQGGYKVDDVLDYMKKQDDVKHIICYVNT